MLDNDISQNLKQFIFEFIDSVELIDVLLFIKNNPEKSYGAYQISDELRSNPKSITMRLESLILIGLIEIDKNNKYRFNPKNVELEFIINELSNEYMLRRNLIYDLIFSSSKSSRRFVR